MEGPVYPVYNPASTPILEYDPEQAAGNPGPGTPRRTILPQADPRYQEVKLLFESYCRSEIFRVNRIEALSNRSTLEPFAQKVELFKQSKPKAQVMRLLHGTPGKNVDSIVESNLLLARNRMDDYARSTQYYCGDGVYFTHSPPYARYHASASSNGHRHIFLFDVLVGDVWTSWSPSERSPPEGYDTGCPADSTVEGYTKFIENEYYPTHLIVLEN